MDTLIVAVSQNAVVRAESEILGCDRCSSGIQIPFSQILSKLRIPKDAEVVYILPVLASCPRCRASIDEVTGVVPREAAGLDATNHPALRIEI
ncbi:MAG TPA: hypothetical protein VFR05_03740 [Terriglobia bacterium]|nr:hypothetical protein [Terriglobia bacterium]